MRRIAFVVLFSLVFCFLLTGYVWAEGATKAECIQKCHEAAKMLQQDKDAAIAEIAKKDGKFVWKDTYVFLMDFKGNMLAHPIKPQLTKKGCLYEVTDKNPTNPKKIFIEFDKVAKSPKGEGWVEYMWPKPGEDKPSLKETYIYRVPGMDMYVGAGIYK